MSDLILRHVAKHIQLTDEEKDFFLSLLTHKTIRKKEFLLHAGEICRHESFVTRGCLRAYTIDAEGEEHLALFALEDWWIGDLRSFVTETPASYTIDALEESEILQIEKRSLEDLYTRVPRFERFFRILIQNAFIAFQKRVLSTISQTAEQRYLEFITKYPTIEQRVPQHQIASYLGMTPEFLSRIRKQLAKK